MKTIRVVVADPFHLTRAALCDLLFRRASVEVAGVAERGRAALHLCRKTRPDVLILEPLLSGPSGLRVIEQLNADEAPTRMLVLSRCGERGVARAALQCGASGYLLKRARPQMFFEALRGVARGEDGWISPDVATELLAPATSSARRMQHLLTPREQEVLTLVAEGASNREIAGRLFVEVSTVKSHVSSVLSKLALPSRAKLIAWVYQQSSAQRPTSDEYHPFG